ncbi:MAG: hypothetical protein IJH42_08995, partial [Atopobiaceae bacterium]|nr:hypothetical protein [Atopobiaceae bacterium]
LEQRPQKSGEQAPAPERIEKLLKSMPGQKRLLLRLIDHCREAKNGEQMDEYTLELQKYCSSVYTPVVLRELLQEAGAIDYLEPDPPAVEELELDEADAAEVAAQEAAREAAKIQTPAVPLVEDGVLVSIDESKVQHEVMIEGDEELTLDYLEVEEREPGLWQATAAGLAIVDAMDDVKATRELLQREPDYLGVYHRILDFCAQAEYGRSPKEIDDLVNDDPLLQKPRRYSGYFVGRLEREGALEWRSGWVVTDAGREVMADLGMTAKEA